MSSKLEKDIQALNNQIHTLQENDKKIRQEFLELYLKGMSQQARLVEYAGMGHVKLYWWDPIESVKKSAIFGPPYGHIAQDEPQPPEIDQCMRTSYESVFQPILNLALGVDELPVKVEERRATYDVATQAASGKLNQITLKYRTQSQAQKFAELAGTLVASKGQSHDGTFFVHIAEHRLL